MSSTKEDTALAEYEKIKGRAWYNRDKETTDD